MVVFAQNADQKLASFEWKTEVRNNKILIECTKGCNFSMLIFDLNKTIVLNENAMVNLDKNPNEIEDSNFLISYYYKDGQLNYQGLKGVSWDNVSVSKNKNPRFILTEKGINTL